MGGCEAWWVRGKERWMLAWWVWSSVWVRGIVRMQRNQGKENIMLALGGVGAAPLVVYMAAFPDNKIQNR